MAKRNKYSANRHVATVGGQECRFDSMAEHRYAEWLERERKAKRIAFWRHHPQPGICVIINNHPLFMLEADFAVWRDSFRYEYHEVKGMATAAWRIKRKVLAAAMPNVAYIVIDAGRGVCATGEGDPALFDERPRKKRRVKVARKKGE